MEKRLLVAIVLCLGILIFWQSVIMPKYAPPRKKTEGEKPAATKTEPEKKAAPAAAPVDTSLAFPFPEPEEKETVLENPVARVAFTNRGAAVREFRLLDYPAPSIAGKRAEGEMVLLKPHPGGSGHFALAELTEVDDEKGGTSIRWAAAMAEQNWTVESAEKNAVEYSYLLRRLSTVFIGPFPVLVPQSVVEIRKRFELDPEKYVLRMSVTIHKIAGADSKLRLRLVPIDGMEHDGDYWVERYAQALAAVRSGEQVSIDDPAITSVYDEVRSFPVWATNPGGGRARVLEWAGVKNRYFAAALIPVSDPSYSVLSHARFRATEKPAGGDKVLVPPRRIICELDTSEIDVGAKPHILQYAFYAGPIERAMLAQAPRDLTQLWNPYGPNIIALAVLWLLNIFHSVFGNYGVAIVFTTVLIRLMLFPLTKKGQVGMHRMQQLNPRMKILRERYKDDPQKMNREIMNLFREEGVSPMSGCLPLLLQLPVWIAMFGVYSDAIELRHSPFLLWIQDLSQPDRLFGPWEKPIPLLIFPLWEINVLPILMTVTWVLQAMFAPKSPDPNMRTQQKMMMFMPIMFGVICYGYASALSFYFFVNSLMAMIEQRIIKRVFLKPAEGKPPA